MTDPTILDDYDIIRTNRDLEAHQREHPDEPAWVLLSPTLLPGAYLLEHGRLELSPIGELCRAEEVVLEALGAGDAESMVRGFLKVASLMGGLYARALQEVEETAERRARAKVRMDPPRDGIRLAVQQAMREPGSTRPYLLEHTEPDGAGAPLEMPEAMSEEVKEGSQDEVLEKGAETTSRQH